MMTRTKTISRKLIATGASLIAMTLATGLAYAQATDFDIEAQPLAKALLEFNKQSGLIVVAPQELINGKSSPAVSGAMEPEEALGEMLNGSGLTYRPESGGAFTITLATAEVESPARPFRVAQADQDDNIRGIERLDEDDDAYSDVVIVTGTNIRGIAPESSPVRSFTREDIQLTGAATAQDFIQTLPQNFGGGSNANIRSAPGDIGAAFNNGQGSSVNLRGLGSGSTLVLLNGKRLAPSSGIGDFVDISMIPATAIERVDVLTDGASSIYGADAVAGVVNFILRDDYEGVEASVRYGSVTQGNLDEHRTNLTAGASWGGGNIIAAYEFFSQTQFSAADREFSRDVLLPNSLMPSQRRHSVLVSGAQEVAPALELTGDFVFSTRESEDVTTNFSPQLVSNFVTPTTQSLSASIGGAWRASDNWFVDFSGVYARTDLEASSGDGTVGGLADDIASEIWTADLIASGDVFALPAGDVKLAIGGHFRSESFINRGLSITREADRDVYAIFGEVLIPIIGERNALPGVHRLEVNVSGRYSDFSDFGTTSNPKVGVLWAPHRDLRLRGSYSTSFNPPALGRVGANDRSAVAYPTALINAQFGISVPPGSPIADVTGLLATGTSTDLDAENSRAFTGGFDFDRNWDAHQLSLSATYFDIEFENRIGVTPVPDNRQIFDVPNIALETPELLPPGTVLFGPTEADITAAISNLGFPLVQFAGADPFDAAFIDFTNVARNLSLTRVRGVDFDMTYTFASQTGVYSLGVDGTYLNDFQQQASVTSPLVERLDTLFNPLSLQMRGRVGYAHNGLSANLIVNYTGSYKEDNTPDAAAIDAWTTVDLNVSYDTQGRFNSSVLNNIVFRVSVLNLFDQNPPETPSVPLLNIYGYDPANASPLNRFIAFEVTKRF